MARKKTPVRSIWVTPPKTKTAPNSYYPPYYYPYPTPYYWEVWDEDGYDGDEDYDDNLDGDWRARSVWTDNRKATNRYRKTKLKKNPYIVLDAPLMIALLEYAYESATSDKELHTIVETMLELIDSYGTLDMECYDDIVQAEEAYTKGKTKASIVPPPAPTE